MSEQFKREDRYIVVKRADLAKIKSAVASAFRDAEADLQSHLPKREFLVIESDWPEYWTAWRAIEARMTGQPPALYAKDKPKLNEEYGSTQSAHTSMLDHWVERRFCEHVRRELHGALFADRDGIAPYNTIMNGSFGPRTNEVIEKFAKLMIADALQASLLDTIDALLSNEDHKVSGGMAEYMPGSPTWQCWEDLRNARKAVAK